MPCSSSVRPGISNTLRLTAIGTPARLVAPLKDYSMADTEPNKPAQRSKHIEPSTADDCTGPPELRMPRTTPASVPEGAPDFATAAAPGELPAAEPTVTQASPDLPEAEKPASELAGSDLQPVEGRDPQGGGTQEPIPRAEPEPT